MNHRYSGLQCSRLLVVSAVATFLISSTQAQSSPPTGDPAYISSDARLELLWNGGQDITEGPAVGPDGTVYFSEITNTAANTEDGVDAGHIWKYNPTTGETTIFRSPSGMSNGMMFDAQDRLIAAEGADYGGQRVTRTDMATNKTYIIAGMYEGRPFNAPNDIAIDEQGRIYFTDPRYLGHEPIEQPVMGVYRIDTDGSIHRILADVGKPNGIAVSPDQRSLYVVSHDNGAVGVNLPPGISLQKGQMALKAYDLHGDGTATFRKTLVDYSPQDGPDGMTVDVEGNLYVTECNPKRLGVAIRSPDGEERAFIPFDIIPRNASFGRGANSHTLYITAGNGLYRIQVVKQGYHLPR